MTTPTTHTKPADAADETTPELEQAGISPETVELARQQMDPGTFPPTLPPIVFRNSPVLDEFRVGEEEQLHPAAKVVTSARADLQYVEQVLAEHTAAANRNPRTTGLAKAEERVKHVGPALAKVRAIPARVAEAQAQLAAEVKAIMGPAAEAALPPTAEQLARYGRMAANYARLSHAEQKEHALDPDVIAAKLNTHPLEWGGSRAEQEALRLSQTNALHPTWQQHAKLRPIRQTWTGLEAVKQAAFAAEQAMLAGVDTRLAVQAGLRPKPIKWMSAAEKTKLVDEIGIAEFERRLVTE